MEKKRTREERSLSGEQTNKALTIWRYKQRKIRAQEESRQTRGTHQLETAGGDRSGHRKNAIK
jgi:hypothetical protein